MEDELVRTFRCKEMERDLETLVTLVTLVSWREEGCRSNGMVYFGFEDSNKTILAEFLMVLGPYYESSSSFANGAQSRRHVVTFIVDEGWVAVGACEDVVGHIGVRASIILGRATETNVSTK